MTAPAYPTVTRCARCGALETAHELAKDQRTRTVRFGMTPGSTTSAIACTGFQPGEVVELVPESELRRRLTAVLTLHEPWGVTPSCSRCGVGQDPWPCPTVRAARGEA